MNTKELLEKLPASWNDVTLEMFQKLSTIQINEGDDVFNGIDNTLAVISKLTNTPVDELEALPMVELNRLATKISFTSTEAPRASKSKLKWKKINDITLDNYISYIQHESKDPNYQLETLHLFIKNFSKTELTEEEILALPIAEALAGFFLFKKKLSPYQNHLIRLNRMKALKQTLKGMYQGFKKIIWK